jgi:hypothetical protein
MARRAGLAALVAAQSVFGSPLLERRQDNPVGLNFNWGGETIRGVNIGGWLVLEPYVIRLAFITLFSDANAR